MGPGDRAQRRHLPGPGPPRRQTTAMVTRVPLLAGLRRGSCETCYLAGHAGEQRRSRGTAPRPRGGGGRAPGWMQEGHAPGGLAPGPSEAGAPAPGARRGPNVGSGGGGRGDPAGHGRRALCSAPPPVPPTARRSARPRYRCDRRGRSPSSGPGPGSRGRRAAASLPGPAAGPRAPRPRWRVGRPLPRGPKAPR